MLTAAAVKVRDVVLYHFGPCHVILLHVGERTWGVLTKLDLMDKGTNALDVSHPASQPASQSAS